jgi:hypothetical protein
MIGSLFFLAGHCVLAAQHADDWFWRRQVRTSVKRDLEIDLLMSKRDLLTLAYLSSGLLRMDPCARRQDSEEGEGEVAVCIHTCGTADTTAYVRYPGGECLANDARGDIDGFILSASGDVVDGIYIYTYVV